MRYDLVSFYPKTKQECWVLLKFLKISSRLLMKLRAMNLFIFNGTHHKGNVTKGEKNRLRIFFTATPLGNPCLFDSEEVVYPVTHMTVVRFI